MAGRAKGARCTIGFVIVVELELKFCDRVETDLVYVYLLIGLKQTW